jgi:hypothetical protein
MAIDLKGKSKSEDPILTSKNNPIHRLIAKRYPSIDVIAKRLSDEKALGKDSLFVDILDNENEFNFVPLDIFFCELEYDQAGKSTGTLIMRDPDIKQLKVLFGGTFFIARLIDRCHRLEKIASIHKPANRAYNPFQKLLEHCVSYVKKFLTRVIIDGLQLSAEVVGASLRSCDYGKNDTIFRFLLNKKELYFEGEHFDANKMTTLILALKHNKIQRLSLVECTFSKEAVALISQALRDDQPFLTSLNLSKSILSKEDFKVLSPGFQSLQRLCLSYIRFDKPMMDIIAPNLQSLVNLDLSGCLGGGGSAQSLAPWLGKGCKVESLIIGLNPLTDVELKLLLSSLGQNKQLSKLSFSSRSPVPYKENATKLFSDFLFLNKTLINLDLYNIRFDPKLYLSSLIPALAEHPSLQLLSLVDTGLVPEMVNRLITGLLVSKDSRLADLGLYGHTNRHNDENFWHISMMLRKNTTLKSLKLSKFPDKTRWTYQGVTNKGIKYLLDAMMYNHTLEDLRVHYIPTAPLWKYVEAFYQDLSKYLKRNPELKRSYEKRTFFDLMRLYNLYIEVIHEDTASKNIGYCAGKLKKVQSKLIEKLDLLPVGESQKALKSQMQYYFDRNDGHDWESSIFINIDVELKKVFKAINNKNINLAKKPVDKNVNQNKGNSGFWKAFNNDNPFVPNGNDVAPS